MYIRARARTLVECTSIGRAFVVQICTMYTRKAVKIGDEKSRLHFNCIRMHSYIAWHIVTLKCDGSACSGLRHIQQFIANLKLICNHTTDDAMNLMRFFLVLLSLSFPLSLSCSTFLFHFIFVCRANDNHTYLCRM